MALETVLIGGELFRIHQTSPQYGIDNIGNPHFLGDDYRDTELEVLRPQFERDGEIYYEHSDLRMPENVFIAYCSVALKKGEKPDGIKHLDGDKFNNDPANLEWIYS